MNQKPHQETNNAFTGLFVLVGHNFQDHVLIHHDIENYSVENDNLPTPNLTTIRNAYFRRAFKLYRLKRWLAKEKRETKEVLTVESQLGPSRPPCSNEKRCISQSNHSPRSVGQQPKESRS